MTTFDFISAIQVETQTCQQSGVPSCQNVTQESCSLIPKLDCHDQTKPIQRTECQPVVSIR